MVANEDNTRTRCLVMIIQREGTYGMYSIKFYTFIIVLSLICWATMILAHMLLGIDIELWIVLFPLILVFSSTVAFWMAGLSTSSDGRFLFRFSLIILTVAGIICVWCTYRYFQIKKERENSPKEFIESLEKKMEEIKGGEKD
jgi:hypothetical protein